ncbi:MAG: hypothetical protein R3Y63_09320 [Eubacteriales bacterium]
MSVQHKETSVKEAKGIKDNKTLTQNVNTLNEETEITNEALIETWMSSMELSEAFVDLATRFFVLQEKVEELEAKLEGGE